MVSVGLALSTPALAAWCPNGPSAPMTTPMFAAAKAKMETSYVNLGMGVQNEINNQAALITAALAVYNQQKVVSAQEFSMAMAKNTQNLMAIKQTLDKQKRMTEVQQEYSARGIGYNVCGILIEQKKTKDISRQAEIAAAEMSRTEVTAAAGKYANRNKALATRLAIHDQLYCTQDQADSGLCTAPGRRAGKNLNSATLFEKAAVGSDTYNDKSAYIDNVIGLPDDPVPTKHINTTAGIAYQDMKRRKDAGRSIAAYGLKWVQARYSVVEHEHSHADERTKSARSEDARLKAAKNAEKAQDTTVENQEANNEAYMVRIKRDVDRYFGGGKEHTEWVKFLVGATEKGVMQENLKVEALNLALLGDRVKAARIKEASIAALVAAEMYNSGAESEIEKMRLQSSVYSK